MLIAYRQIKGAVLEGIDETVCINLTRSEIKGSPEYEPSQPINRAAEEQLYDYYQRPRYWLP